MLGMVFGIWKRYEMVCVGCGKLRSDSGEWKDGIFSPEENSEIKVAYGICSFCADQFDTQEDALHPRNSP